MDHSGKLLKYRELAALTQQLASCLPDSFDHLIISKKIAALENDLKEHEQAPDV